MRTGKARQLDTTSQPKDYCDSLAQLPGLVEASQQPNAHAPALVPFVLGPEGEADRPKLVVCHDYKVGDWLHPARVDLSADLGARAGRLHGGWGRAEARLHLQLVGVHRHLHIVGGPEYSPLESIW